MSKVLRLGVVVSAEDERDARAVLDARERALWAFAPAWPGVGVVPDDVRDVVEPDDIDRTDWDRGLVP